MARLHIARGYLFAALILCIIQVHAELKLVYYFNRYGARNVLSKSSLLQESNATGGPSLLPIGRLQNRAVGSAFRSRYLDNQTCGSTCLTSSPAAKYGVYGDPGVDFHNYNTLIRSSGLDRTVSAANAFLGGVFPDASKSRLPDPLQAPPVYSQTDSEDWLIRSYTKCNVYLDRLSNWYTSDEFKGKEATSKPLRDSVAAAAPGLDTSLKNWGTVTDAFRVWTLFGYGGPYPDLGNSTYQQIIDLGNWLQSKQMASSMTGNLLGGPLLADMLSYMAKAVAASDQDVYYKLLGISSHYNVLMMVGSALRLDQDQSAASYPWLNRIPSFASFMAFELYQQGSTAAVQLVYSDGEDQFVTIPLPCAVKGSDAEKLAGVGACSWEDFKSYAANPAISTSDQWCGLCQNRGVQACQAYWLQAQAAKAGRRVGGAKGRDLAVCGVVVGLGAVLLTLAAVSVFAHYTSVLHHKNKLDPTGMSAPIHASHV